jgi:hypothetical protein
VQCRIRLIGTNLALFPPPPNLVDPLTGKSIPPPPPLATVASGGGRQHNGCAPVPSLASMHSQPLETLTVYQPDGGNASYRYAAGTSAREIGHITAEFSDGTTAQATATGLHPIHGQVQTVRVSVGIIGPPSPRS